MDLRRLRYFCAVIEQGNLTKAARALNMAQPPLSRRLRELEEEIGAVLFLRDGHSMTPTPAGYHLYRRAGEILRDVEQATQETVAMSRREYRVLRIGMTHLFQKYFTPLLVEIHRRNPHIEIGVSVCDSSQLETQLSDRLIDIALMQRPSQDDSFDCVDLTPQRAVAVISNRLDSSRYKDAIPFSAIGEYPLALLRRASGSGTYEGLLDQFRRSGIDSNVILRISQPGVILDWLEYGLEAATLLPASEVDPAQLRNCRMLEITPSPVMFFPAIVKLTILPSVAEVDSLIAEGFPLNTRPAESSP